MAEGSLPELDSPINQFDSFHSASYPSCRAHESARVPRVSPCQQPQAQPCLPAPAANMALHFTPQLHYGGAAPPSAKGESPREVRNKAEKMRRDRLNQSVSELALIVPPVAASGRKIDKTTVLRLTAHYLRAHQYVFGDSIGQPAEPFNPASILTVLSMFNGFLITTTYRGIIVVVSQNVNQYLGYTELDLLGQNLLTITHEGDRAMLRDQLMPRSQTLGPNGELVIPDEPDATRKVEEALAHETRRFVIRLKKLGQRSEPSQYITCHVEGSLRKSDRACRGVSRCCRIVRRARARSENPCSSGNDIVFIGMIRPTSETFINESALESYRMEYRTRHSIDGEIIQCDSRIAIVTGYMIHEVSGVNAMNFMHRDDVRWVIIALREMYDQHRMFGESCYRLITKNGQFIYMRTRGCLDVDRDTRAVTSFVCTNTVVDEEEGKKLIKLMKRKFSLLVNNNEASAIEEMNDDSHDNEDQNADHPAPVEDPRRLEQVILHLVTNLPSPSPQESETETFTAASPKRKAMSPHRLTIIPPNKERIVSAIEKIYSVINITQKDSNHEESNYEPSTSADWSHSTPQYMQPVEMNSFPAPQEAQIVPYQSRHVSNYMQAPDSASVEPKAYSTKIDYEQMTSPDWSHSTAQHMQSVDMNTYRGPQEVQIVPYQSRHVSNYVQALDSGPVEPMANDIQNNYEPSTSADWSHSTPQYMQSVEMNGFPDPQEAQIVPHQSRHCSNYVQAYDISEDDIDVDDILNAVASPDMGFFDNSEGPFSNLSQLLINFAQNGEMFNDQQMADLQEFEYHGAESSMTMPMPQYAEEPNMLQALPQASTSDFLCGTKRPNDFEDSDMVYKKKITESEFVRENEETSDFESSLEYLFDVSSFDSDQIESAVNSADYVDQMLIDKMETVDVAKVLSQIELEAKQEMQRFQNE